MCDNSSNQDQHGLQPDQEALLIERVWFAATERAVKYLKFRYLWFVPIVGLVLAILSFAGFSAYVKYLTREEISQTLREELQAASLRIDSLVTSADSSVAHLRNAKYLSGQMEILMRQYQFMLSSEAEKATVGDSVTIPVTIKQRYDQLESGKGLRMTFSRVGNPEQISIFIAKEDSVYTILELPASLVSAHIEELKAERVFMVPPPKDSPPTLVLRSENYYPNIEGPALIMDRLAGVLLGKEGKVIIAIQDWTKE